MASFAKQFVKRVKLVVKRVLVIWLFGGGQFGKKSALENLDIRLRCDLVVPRTLARGEAPAHQLLPGIKDEDGH